MNKFERVYRSIIKEANEGTSISIKPVLKKITKIEDLKSGILLGSTTCSHVFYEINSVYKQGDKIKFYWKAQYRFSPDLKQYLDSSTGNKLLQPRPFTFDEVQEYYEIVDKATTDKIMTIVYGDKWKAKEEFEQRQVKTPFNRKKANFDSIVQKINQVFRKYHIKNRSWTSQWGKQKYNNVAWNWEGLHGKDEHLMLSFEIHTGKATWEKGLRSEVLDLSTVKSAQQLIDRYINEKYWEELKWDKEEREIEEKQEKQKEEEQKRKKAAQWEAQQRDYNKGLEWRREMERRRREEWWNTVGKKKFEDEIDVQNYFGNYTGALRTWDQYKEQRARDLECRDIH